MKRWAVFLLTFLMALTFLAGCSSTGMNQNSYAASPSAVPQAERSAIGTVSDSGGYGYPEEDLALWDDEAPMEAAEPRTGGGEIAILPESESVAGVERKIITNFDLNMQTREFDDAIEEVGDIVDRFDGMIQSSWVQGRSLYNEYGARYASFTVRIPAEQAQEFVDQLRDQYHVTDTQQYTNDITGTYYDVQARLQTLRVREERLMEMLEQAEELEYLLEVDRELSYVRYEIESLTISLQRMDNSVSLSTINLYLEEVIEYDRLPDQPVSFGSRISYTVSNSMAAFALALQNLLLGLIMLLPWLIIIIIVAIAVIMLVRRHRKNRKQPPPSSSQTEPVQFSEIPRKQEDDNEPDPEK